MHCREDIVKNGYFKATNDVVDVSDGPAGDIPIVIVGRKFDGHRLKEKYDMIWSELSQKLNPNEGGKASLSIGVSPEERKAI